MNAAALADLLAWMREREAIRRRRAAGLPRHLWTNDPILARYHFCNVFRTDDTVTRWLRRVYDRAGLLSGWRDDLWMLAAMARLVNQIGTLRRLFGDLRVPLPVGEASDDAPDYHPDWFDPTTARCALQSAPRPRFRPAYIIAGGARAGQTKEEFVVSVWEALWACRTEFRLRRRRPGPFTSLQGTTVAFAGFYGIGGFLAYEIACDLTYSPAWLADAPDRWTWAHLGPGARRGLARVWGHADGKWRGPESMAAAFDALWPAVKRLWRGRPLECRDLEHSLCEFDKYERVRCGGTYRRRYAPTEAS